MITKKTKRNISTACAYVVLGSIVFIASVFFWKCICIFLNISSRYACSQIYIVCNNIRNDFNIRLVRI